MVLGQPVAVVAERLAQAREVERVGQRVGAGRALGDRGLVEDAQPHPDKGRRQEIVTGTPGRTLPASHAIWRLSTADAAV